MCVCEHVCVCVCVCVRVCVSCRLALSLAGYAFGSLASSPCENYGGKNLCGPAGSPVPTQALTCSGSELSVGECSWSAPDPACSGHKLDSVVFCGEALASDMPEGAVRLLSTSGAPSLSGTGLLEVHVGGVWTSVCGIVQVLPLWLARCWALPAPTPL